MLHEMAERLVGADLATDSGRAIVEERYALLRQ